jgi:hypothetical protein
MLTRTYPSECTVYNCDYLIVSAIRDRIGDKPNLKRYYIPVSGDFSKYVPYDTSTFYDGDTRFWPYHIQVGATVCSGVTSPQTMDYHYMNFTDPSYNLTASGIDFWVESFRLSDYEIWTAYLSVDLTGLVKNPDCITEDMNILKAAIDLVPALRTNLINSLYIIRDVTDRDTRFRQQLMAGADPFKDLVSGMQKELDKIIDICNKTPINDGWRLE